MLDLSFHHLQNPKDSFLKVTIAVAIITIAIAIIANGNKLRVNMYKDGVVKNKRIIKKGMDRILRNMRD